MQLSKVRTALNPSIRRKILTLAIAPVVTMTICAGALLLQVRTSIQSQVFDNQTTLGQTYAHIVRDYLDDSQTIIESLADAPQLRAPLDVGAIQPDLHGVAADADLQRRGILASALNGSRRFQKLVISAANGDAYVGEPFSAQQGLPMANMRELHFKIDPLGIDPFSPEVSAAPLWSDVVVDPFTHQPKIILQVPVKDLAGNVQGVLAATIKLDSLAEAARTALPGGTDVMLFDRRGSPIVSRTRRWSPRMKPC